MNAQSAAVVMFRLCPVVTDTITTTGEFVITVGIAINRTEQ